MKIGIITDTHFDIKNGNERIYEQQIKFVDYMVDYMIDHKIETLFHLGDFFHNRQHVSVNIMNYVANDFLQKLYENNITLYILVGNHDAFTKTSNVINSIYPLVQNYENIHLIKNQQTILVDGIEIEMVPWLHDDSLELSDVEIVMGHFEMKDFLISKNYSATHGIDHKEFKNKLVLSGHYHIRQTKDNIHYLGSPYQNTWDDFGQDRGFHVFDPKTKEIEFVPNELSTKHIKVYLDNDTKECVVLGFGDERKYKVDKKFDYNIFKDHKVKVFSEKERIFTKNFIQDVEKVAMSTKLELLDVDDELEIDEALEKIKEQDVTKKIIHLVDDEDKEDVKQILSEAYDLMNEELNT